MNRDYLANIPDVTKANATIKMNGVVLDWISFEVNSTNTHAADTFEIEIPLYDQKVKDLQIVLDTESLEVEIAVDDGSGTYVRILLGLVDDYIIDPIIGMVTFTGRDLTSLLMDKKALTSKVISNLTASAVAQDYASEHDLKADVVDTLTPVGTYDSFHTVYLTGNTTEWDVLCQLAQNEDYDVYMTNDTLHFKPRTEVKNYYRIDWDYADKSGFEASNALKLKLRRTVTIANDIKVEVKGWNMLDGKKYTKTYSRSHSPQRVRSRSKTQTYFINADGATPDAVSQIAENALRQLSSHQKSIDLELVGDAILTSRSIIKLTGFGFNFDQLYYPYTIRRSMSFDKPYLMEVSAKNHDVNTQVK